MATTTGTLARRQRLFWLRSSSSSSSSFACVGTVSPGGSSGSTNSNSPNTTKIRQLQQKQQNHRSYSCLSSSLPSSSSSSSPWWSSSSRYSSSPIRANPEGTGQEESEQLTGEEEEEENVEPRDSMAFDVLIVGGGPAGLAAAIRIRQLCLERDRDLSVCVIDKGSEIGAHILSGNVFDPKSLHELFPDQADANDPNHWAKELEEWQGSVSTPVTDDQFLVLPNGTDAPYRIPNLLLPPQIPVPMACTQEISVTIEARLLRR